VIPHPILFFMHACRKDTVTIKGLNEISTAGMSYENRDQLVRQLREMAKKELLV
jgi:hypothetical protein